MKDVCQSKFPYSINSLETDRDWLIVRLAFLWWMRENHTQYYLEKGFGNEKHDIYSYNIMDNDFIDRASAIVEEDRFKDVIIVDK